MAPQPRRPVGMRLPSRAAEMSRSNFKRRHFAAKMTLLLNLSCTLVASGHAVLSLGRGDIERASEWAKAANDGARGIRHLLVAAAPAVGNARPTP